MQTAGSESAVGKPQTRAGIKDESKTAAPSSSARTFATCAVAVLMASACAYAAYQAYTPAAVVEPIVTPARNEVWQGLAKGIEGFGIAFRSTIGAAVVILGVSHIVRRNMPPIPIIV
jgi:drug/metabolite transporter (DMT)-like permease